MKGKKENKIKKNWEDVYKQLFDLTPAYIEHLARSMKAEMVCTNCDLTIIRDSQGNVVEEKFSPRKAKDELGRCKFCHNTGIVPNEAQRNFAATQLGVRLAPVVKGADLTNEGKDEATEAKELREVSDKDLERMLGIKFTEGTSGSGQGA